MITLPGHFCLTRLALAAAALRRNKALPVFLVIVVIPLIMVSHVYHVSPELNRIVPGWVLDIDLFTYWKEIILFWLSSLSFCTMLFVKKHPPTIFLLGVFTYITAAMLSSKFSHYPILVGMGAPNYNEGTMALFSYAVLLLSSAAFATESGYLKRLKGALICSVIGVGFFCLLQWWYGNIFNIFLLGRLVKHGNMMDISAQPRPIYGTLMNSNHLGLYCAMMMPFIFSYAIPSKNKSWFILVALLSYMSLGSETGGCWGSIFVTTVFIVTRYKKAISRKVVYAATAISLLSALSYRAEIINKLTPMVGDFKDPFRNASLSGRMFVWKNTIPLIQDNILIGSGPGTFMLDFPAQFDSFGKLSAGWLQAGIVVDRPHNIYLNIIHDTGLLSLSVLFILSVEYLLPTLFVAFVDRDALAFSMGIVGYLIAGFFTDSMVGVTPIFFILCGSLVGLELWRGGVKQSTKIPLSQKESLGFDPIGICGKIILNWFPQ